MAGYGQSEGTVVDASAMTLGIVAARWHAELVDQMVHRSKLAARECGVERITLARVEGSIELPVVAQALARRCDAVVALGVVIRGATAHFDYVCRSVTDGLTRVALDESTPVGNGVLTVDSLDQARDRAGWPDSAEDKGWAATIAALNSVAVVRDIRHGVG